MEISNNNNHNNNNMMMMMMNSTQYSNYGQRMDTSFQNIDFTQETQHMIYSPPKTQFLDRTTGKGLEVSGTFSYRSGILFMNLTMTNLSLGVLSDFTVAINRNTFGIGLSPGAVFPHRLAPQQTAEVTVPLNSRNFYFSIKSSFIPCPHTHSITIYLPL